MSDLAEKELRAVMTKAAKDALLAAAATVKQMGSLVVWDQKGVIEFLVDCAGMVDKVYD